MKRTAPQQSTPEEAIKARNSRLARAVGYWKIADWHKGMRIVHLVGFENGDIMKWDFVDDPDGHFAKARLLSWLDDQYYKLKQQFVDAIYVAQFRRRPQGLSCANLVQLMTVTPDQVADMLDRVLTESGFYRDNGIE